jgi:putative mRNA 3-end processing factor
MGGGRALVIAPPSVAGSRWLGLFGETSVASVSGWMTLRGMRRRRGFDKGFVLSDHADFPGLNTAIEASRARRVLVTHGFADTLARLLRDRGLDASVLPTRFTGEATPDAARGDSPGEDEESADGLVMDNAPARPGARAVDDLEEPA